MTTATIPSRTSSQSYTVCLGDDGTASCTCTAGSFGKSCRHVKLLRAEAERRNAGELAECTATIAREEAAMAARGHLMGPGEFQALQRRYWAARERAAELVGVPLLTLG